MRQAELLLEKPLPSNADAERSILGCLLLDSDLFAETAGRLRYNQFHSRSNGLIYAAMGKVVARGDSLSPVLLIEQLQADGDLDSVGGIAYLAGLTDGAVRYSDISGYVNSVLRSHARREIIHHANAAAQRALDESIELDEVIEQTQSAFFDLAAPGHEECWQPIGDVVYERAGQIAKFAASGKRLLGLATGFDDLDTMTGGLQPGQLVGVAGRPAMGKTSFAIGVAKNAAAHEENEGKGVAVFELEMSRGELADRVVSVESGVNMQRIRTNNLTRDEVSRVEEARERFAKMPIFIDDTPGASAMDIRSKLRKLMRRKEIGVVVVDYIDLMTCTERTQSEAIRMSTLSRQLKAIGKEFGVAVIAVYPISKGADNLTEHRPALKDLRYGGEFELDLCLMLYRDEYYHPETIDKGIAEVLITKQRNGPTGKIRLQWQEQTTAFRNLVREYETYSAPEPRSKQKASQELVEELGW